MFMGPHGRLLFFVFASVSLSAEAVSAEAGLRSAIEAPSVAMCPHDKLGNSSWPPTAVYRAPLIFSQHQPHTGTSIHNEADSAVVFDPVATSELNARTAAGQVAHSTERPFIESIVKTLDAAVLGMQPGFGALLPSQSGCQDAK
ncbi:hypothetical protein ABBQ32_007290 [Trebouxia sp. C0010 RCD-2024]